MDRITAARVFVEAVERGSLSAAAERLGLSRAMASRYLTRLEDWAGVRLLHRTTRRLSLTGAGDRILPLCREMLALEGAVTALAAPAEQPEGLVRIAAPPMFAQNRLVAVVLEFLRRYPAVRVDLQVSDQVADLVEERIDVAVRISNRVDPALIARPLGWCRSVLCAAPDYLRRCGIPQSPQDLPRYSCLSYSGFGGHRWTLDGPRGFCTVDVSGGFSANDSLIVLQAALGGAGIAMLPVFAAAGPVARGDLTVVLPDWQPEVLAIQALYSSRRHMPAAQRALIDYLVTALADLTGPPQG